jgi:hypothetical protein
MDFSKAFQGFSEATPDGQLPKINAPHMDGIYEFEVISSEGFHPKDQNEDSYSFKAEVMLLSATTNKIPVGQKASIIIHGLVGGKDYVKAKHWGNLKAFLAAAMGSLTGSDVSPLDQSQDWLGLVQMACEVDDTLQGARVRLQVNTEKAGKEKDGKEFAKMNFEPIFVKAAA